MIMPKTVQLIEAIYVITCIPLVILIAVESGTKNESW